MFCIRPTLVTGSKGRKVKQPESPRPPERNLAHARALKAGPCEPLPLFETSESFPTLGCNFDLRRQRRSSSSNRFDQSKLQQHHFRTDCHPDGDGDKRRVDPCNGIERNVIHTAVQRREPHCSAYVNDDLHGNCDELERKRQRADDDYSRVGHARTVRLDFGSE